VFVNASLLGVSAGPRTPGGRLLGPADTPSSDETVYVDPDDDRRGFDR